MRMQIRHDAKSRYAGEVGVVIQVEKGYFLMEFPRGPMPYRPMWFSPSEVMRPDNTNRRGGYSL